MIIAVCFANAQHHIDSLKNIIKNSGNISDHERNELLTSYDSVMAVHLSTENYDSLIVYGDRIAQLHLMHDDLDNYIRTANRTGYYHTLNGELDEAIEVLLENLSFVNEYDQHNLLPETYAYLGLAYKHFDQDKALEFFNLSTKNESDTLSVYYNTSLNEIANIYNASGRYKEALDYYFRSLRIKEGSAKGHLDPGIVFSYNDIAVAYENMHDYDRAIYYLQQCIALADDPLYSTSKYHRCAFYSNIANLYTIAGQYDQSAFYLHKGLTLATELHNHSLLELIHIRYYAQFKAAGNPEDALEHFELAVQYRDSLNNVDLAKKIADLDIQYQTAKKEADLQLLKKENYVRGLSIVFILVLLMVVGIAATVIIIKQMKLRKAEKTLNEVLKKELEYKKREVLNLSAYAKQRIAFTRDILTKLKGIRSDSNKVMEEIRGTISFISLNYHSEQKLINEVYSQIEDINKVFAYRIREKHDNLTDEDIRLSSLLILQLSSKEIADILFINPKSVEMKRYRLRRKLNLDKDSSLTAYLRSI